jgi:PIH1 N-terminal domain/PIH1 CS-like domain
MEVIGDLNSSLHKLFVTKYNKCTNDASLKCLVPNCALDCLNQGGQVALEDDKSRFENETPLQDEVLDPGYVIKAMLEDGTKVIVNVYKSEKIGKPTLENRIGNDGRSSKAWAIPHGFSHCLNHKGSNDNTFNFLVHPNTYRMGETNSGFYKMVNDLAMSELVKKFGFRVDGNLVYVDNAKYNDDSSRDSIQNGSELKPEMQSEMTSNLKPDASGVKSSFDDLDNRKIINSGAKGKKGKFLTPAYKIFCTTTAVSPENAAKHFLTIEVDLPLVKTAATISVNIRKRKLVLVTREPVMYKLEIELPEGVNKSSKQVHFDKVGRKFTVSLQYVVLKNGEEPRSCPESDTCASGDSFSLMHGDTELPSISRDVSALTSTAKSSVHNHAETSSNDQTNHVSLTPRIPEYSGRVEPTALSFVFHVSGVKKDMTNFKVISPYSCLLEMSSMDKCSKEKANFVCCFKFEEQCLILENGCMVDVSEHNVALIIAKDPHSSGNWDFYSVGATFDDMEVSDS